MKSLPAEVRTPNLSILSYNPSPTSTHKSYAKKVHHLGLQEYCVDAYRRYFI